MGMSLSGYREVGTGHSAFQWPGSPAFARNSKGTGGGQAGLVVNRLKDSLSIWPHRFDPRLSE